MADGPAIEAPAIEAAALTRTYGDDGKAVHGLNDVSLKVASGESVAVMGPSGSGKSTLLYLLAGLDQPDSGSIWVAGTDWKTLEGTERARFRLRNCGFIAQGLSLLPQATAAENVEVPLLLGGVKPELRRSKVAAALERVELGDHATKLVDQLSGGQQQRAAIARALINDPGVVLADEPTANLDSATAAKITSLLVEAAAEHGAAVVLVTHDPEVGRHAGRIVRLHSGRVEGTG